MKVTGGRQLTDNPKDVARMLKKDGKDSDIRIGDCRLSGIPKSRTSVCTEQCRRVSQRLFDVCQLARNVADMW
ncbi:TraD [Klebsiella pneumoniae]|uniref:TraD n=1 Tax=Klebsiella pneumoniae TaxID=573 RepID=A0A378H408_KLEPN|nr:TraD [Klebsiella pneumoniae]